MVPRRRLLLGLILVLGAALRLVLYCSRPSLSIDETMLGLEIGTHSLAGLLQPLAYAQTGPPLFLWGIKLIASTAGMSEYALRAIPLATGLLIPFMMWRVGRRLLGEPAGLFAAALAALAPTLVQYSVIVKPYITDALFALTLASCTLDLLELPNARGVWLRLGLVGLLAAIGSVPAPFLLAGVTAAILLGVRPLEPAVTWRLVACLVMWGAAFLPPYAWVYRPVAVSEYMQQFWGASFFAPAQLEDWPLLGRSLVQALVARPMPLAVVPPVVALFGLGLWSVWRRCGRPVAALLGVPLLALLGASLVQRYPLSARLLLFVAPCLLLSCAASIDAAAAWRRGVGRVLGAVVVAAFAGINLTHPYRTPATRLAVAAVNQRAAPLEPIYVASGGIPAWAFYTTDWSAPDTGYLRWVSRWAGQPGAGAFHNSAARGHAVTTDEGRDLWMQRGGRQVLFGLGSGIQWREGRGFARPVIPDTGWAAREAERIRAAAAPTVWVLVANPYPTTVRDLFAALQIAGGVLETESAVGGVRVDRFRFTP